MNAFAQLAGAAAGQVVGVGSRRGIPHVPGPLPSFHPVPRPIPLPWPLCSLALSMPPSPPRLAPPCHAPRPAVRPALPRALTVWFDGCMTAVGPGLICSWRLGLGWRFLDIDGGGSQDSGVRARGRVMSEVLWRKLEIQDVWWLPSRAHIAPPQDGRAGLTSCGHTGGIRAVETGAVVGLMARGHQYGAWLGRWARCISHIWFLYARLRGRHPVTTKLQSKHCQPHNKLADHRVPLCFAFVRAQLLVKANAGPARQQAASTASRGFSKQHNVRCAGQ